MITKEDDRTLPHDAGVERAVLALLLVSGRSGLLEKLDAADFLHPLHQFVFTELRLMAEAGEPLGDAHAVLRWFRQPAALRRSNGLLQPDDVAATLAEISIEYATLAHEGYYLQTLAKERLRRGLQLLARGIMQHDAADPANPMATLDWAQRQFDLVWAKASESFPEALVS